MTILLGHPRRTVIIFGLIVIALGYYYRFEVLGGLLILAGMCIIGSVILYGMTALCNPWLDSRRRG
jgi:hypothetical protein